MALGSEEIRRRKVDCLSTQHRKESEHLGEYLNLHFGKLHYNKNFDKAGIAALRLKF
jgi:hypothetical protein